MLGLFLTQGAVGCLLALLLIPPRAGGRAFFRYALAQTALLLILGMAAARSSGEQPRLPLLAFGALTGLLVLSAGLFHVGRLEAGRWLMLVALPAGLAGVSGDALALIPPHDSIASASLIYPIDAVTSGLTTGGALVAMMLGHAYLNIPGLPIRFLERLSLALFLSVVLRAGVVATSLALSRAGIAPLLGLLLDPAAAPPETAHDPFVLVGLLVHLLCGLAAPAAFSLMAWRSAKAGGTQSATGILYVALVVLIMGELASRYLLTLTGLPL